MSHSRTGRPLTTYSRRRSRRRESNSHASDTRLSPIRPLSPDQEEVGFAVMADRMNKRARLVARSSASSNSAELSAQKESEDRPPKRQKPIPAYDSDKDAPNINYMRSNTDYMRDIRGPESTQICTPRVSMPSDQSMAISSASRPPPAPDLSSLPVAKRIIARTSSRNFKENAGHVNSRSLASPFNSRPASRVSSPNKNPLDIRNRFDLHSKPRTLAQPGALREKTVDRNITAAMQMAPGALFATAVNSTQDSSRVKVSVPAHVRSSSIPTLKPALDRISAAAWLVPPKALSRSSPAVDPDNNGDNQEMADCHSFFADAPIQISTPPRRKRSATISEWAHGLMPQLDADPPLPIHSFRYDSDVDMSDNSLPGSPTDSRSSRCYQPRRRRRTIVHLPSDSLFSSSLDFSALMSETQRFPRAPASEGSRSPEQPLIVESELGPAFSPSSVPHTSTCNSLSVTHARRSSNPASPSSFPLCDAFPLPGPPPSSPSSGLVSVQADRDSDGDELLNLFSVLGLDEDEKWTADDSGVALHDSISCPQSREGISKPAKSVRVSRKRGDTIRASDFASLPVSASAASLSSASASGSSGLQRGPPRRTRSGTVTQAISCGSGKRKHEGWPTIRMRTCVEPLRANEDEEDELLLKDGDVVE